MALTGLYQVRWSEEILLEVERNLERHVGVVTARERVSTLRQVLPEAMVSEYADELIGLRNDPKDRHIVAAAIKGEATIIVTANLKHFRPLPAGILALEPDTFLSSFLDQVEVVLQSLRDVLMYWPQPPRLEQFLDRLETFAPRFVAELRAVVKKGRYRNARTSEDDSQGAVRVGMDRRDLHGG